MEEYECENCNAEFTVDILNPEYHLYPVKYCPHCGTAVSSDYYDDEEDY